MTRDRPETSRDPSALGHALVDFVTSTLEALTRAALCGWRLPGVFGGRRVGGDVRADAVFTLGLLAGAGVDEVTGVATDELITGLLGNVDGAATDTFSSYRIAETLLRAGPFADNALLAPLDDHQRHEVAVACDSTGFVPLLDGLLPGNYAAVLARCEAARHALGLPVDTAVLDDLLERTESLLNRRPGGYHDDSEDGRGDRYDIYTVDLYLFCEPLADTIGAPWLDGLGHAIALVERTLATNGAAVAWGRSTGLLALCHTVELATLALERGLGDDAGAWLSRGWLAFDHLGEWFAADGLVTAHQHRSPYDYRGSHRRLQMTLDCLGKLAWAAGRLARLPGGPGGPTDAPTLAAGEPLPDVDELVVFAADTGAGVWAHRGAHQAFVVPLVGPAHSDYLPAPSQPGRFEQPVDSDLSPWVPTAWSDGVAYCGGGCPGAASHEPGRLRLHWDSLVEVSRPGSQGRTLPTARDTEWRVEGRSLVLEERLHFTSVPEALAVSIPEADGAPLRVEFTCDTEHRATVVDTDGVKEWRSFWGPLPRVHELDMTPTATVGFTARITPLIVVSTEAGHHHYHRSLYAPIAAEVHEQPVLAHEVADRVEARRRLGHVAVHHLHWPEWFTGADLGAARRFTDALHDNDVRLLWTQHNLVPHLDGDWDELYEHMAAHADAVVHHSRWGMERARNRWRYRADALHRVIPHGHWGNLAPGHDDPAWRAEQRAVTEAELDLTPCSLRLGILGAPRRDKDTLGFLSAFAACGRDDLGLLALSLTDDELPAVPDDPRIHAEPYRFVDRATYDRRLAAIDLLVLPFAPAGQMLTTGVAADALAGGVPALVTSWPYLDEALGVAGIPMGDGFESWTETLETLEATTVHEAAGAIGALRVRHDWSVVADAHLSLLEELTVRRRIRL